MQLLHERPLYQLWLLYSPLPRPLHLLALHCWLVVKAPNGIPSRWEVWQNSSCCASSWGHVHRDLFPPGQGIVRDFWPGGRRRHWEARIGGYMEGEAAEGMVRFVCDRAEDYPCRDRYFPWPGPNSNTFVQWVLNHFPGQTLRLPRKSLGSSHNVPLLW
ncbi:MAG: DUF3750 domain-containing protein [Proteobacteria bacterium]|nr:DUF3750 domain-containing protein [Pseudomonadota bacterium]